MTIIVQNVLNLLRLLHSEAGQYQLSAGVAAGFILGMTPFLSLQSFIVFVFILFFRVQFTAAFVTAFFFSFIAFGLDPLFHHVGKIVLSTPSLYPLWETMYNTPLIPYTRFNNTIVMGSAVVTLFLSPLIFMLSLLLIKKYRNIVVTKFKGTKFFKAFKASKLYKLYSHYNSLYPRS